MKWKEEKHKSAKSGFCLWIRYENERRLLYNSTLASSLCPCCVREFHLFKSIFPVPFALSPRSPPCVWWCECGGGGDDDDDDDDDEGWIHKRESSFVPLSITCRKAQHSVKYDWRRKSVALHNSDSDVWQSLFFSRINLKVNCLRMMVARNFVPLELDSVLGLQI